jgi:hypothetical protein
MGPGRIEDGVGALAHRLGIVIVVEIRGVGQVDVTGTPQGRQA